MDPSATDLKTQILEKAAADPAFHQRLLADPRAAVEEALGFPVPADIQFEVLEETAGKVYLVVPQASDPSLAELSETELDTAGVSGGSNGSHSWNGDCCHE